MSSLNFHKLTLRNFQSYGNATTEIVLDGGGTIQIQGMNLDDTVNGVGANGVGKAAPLHSKIKTPTGWTTMGAIKSGDVISTPDGGTAQVTSLHPQGSISVYRLTFADGRSCEASGKHLWSISSHRLGHRRSTIAAVDVVTTEDIIQYLDRSAGMNYKPEYNIYIPTITHPTVPDKDVPISPYLLGVLLSAGCKFGDHAGLKIVEADMRDMRLYEDNFSPTTIPPMYIEGTSKQQKLDLLAGLLDTKGVIGKTQGVSFQSTNKRLVEGVQCLVRSLGGTASMSIRTTDRVDDVNTLIDKETTYVTSINYAQPRDLFRLPSKKKKLPEVDDMNNDQRLRIVSVEQIEDAECQCIVVDHPDHLYITDDYVVTHNSSIINGLVYAVYGQPLGDIKLDNIVNDVNKKNCVVGATFSIDGTMWEVVRYRKMKSGADGNYIEIFKDGNTDLNLAKSTIPETNKLLSELVGMPFDLFVRLVVFDADETSFFKLKAGDQRDVMENLFMLTMLSEKAEAIKSQQDAVKGDLSDQERHIKTLELGVTQYTKAIETATDRLDKWEHTRAGNLSTYKSTVLSLSDIDIEHERSLFDAIEEAAIEIAEYEQRYVEVNNKIERERTEIYHISSNIATFQKTINTCTSGINSANTSMNSANTSIKRLNEEIKTLELNVCPECNQSMPDVESNIKERMEKIDIKLGDITSLGENIEALKVATADEEASILECNQVMGTHTDALVLLKESAQAFQDIMNELKGKLVSPSVASREELSKIESSIEQSKDRVKEIEQSINPHIDAHTEALAGKPEDIDYTKIDILTKTLDHQKFMVKLLTDKKSFIRKHLINKRLPYLNERLTYYLKMLGLPHRVEFLSDLTPSITRRGSNMDFGNFSHGQKARVNFALSFAFRDVLERLHRKVNVCLLDEVLDKALCDVGANSAVTMINEKAKADNLTMFVITHKRELANRFGRVMVVKLKDGFSYIE